MAQKAVAWRRCQIILKHRRIGDMQFQTWQAIKAGNATPVTDLIPSEQFNRSRSRISERGRPEKLQANLIMAGTCDSSEQVFGLSIIRTTGAGS